MIGNLQLTRLGLQSTRNGQEIYFNNLNLMLVFRTLNGEDACRFLKILNSSKQLKPPLSKRALHKSTVKVNFMQIGWIVIFLTDFFVYLKKIV